MRIARLAATLPTLEHFERPELLDALEQLTANRRTLAGAPRQLIGLFGQALRAIGIVVLLATIYLPVLVVPLLALAPALSDRAAGARPAARRRRAGRGPPPARRAVRARHQRRRRRASCAPTGSPTRSPSATRELAERVRRRAVRAALLSAGWEALGWLVFAVGARGGDRRARAARRPRPRQPGRRW